MPLRPWRSRITFRSAHARSPLLRDHPLLTNLGRKGTPVDLTTLSPGNRRDELIAITALVRAKARSVPVNRLATLIDHAGSAVELVQLPLEAVLFNTPDADCRLAGAVNATDLEEARQMVDGWLRRELDVRTVLDPNYPVNLHSIFDRPPLLFFEGDWVDRIDSNSVAVVGTRSASPHGLARARRLAAELVESGYTILSGLAAGVDAAAHQSALKAGGRTAAVMGTGLDHRYPASNRALSERIVQARGALVTQFFPHQTPRRWMFPQRNVVMSGLSLATVVVEAGNTSGAKMQARVALQHGRTVFLLRSLVESREWARRYVQEGAYGGVAIEVASTADIVSRLEANHHETRLTA